MLAGTAESGANEEKEEADASDDEKKYEPTLAVVQERP